MTLLFLHEEVIVRTCGLCGLLLMTWGTEESWKHYYRQRQWVDCEWSCVQADDNPNNNILLWSELESYRRDDIDDIVDLAEAEW